MSGESAAFETREGAGPSNAFEMASSALYERFGSYPHGARMLAMGEQLASQWSFERHAVLSCLRFGRRMTLDGIGVRAGLSADAVRAEWRSLRNVAVTIDGRTEFVFRRGHEMRWSSPTTHARGRVWLVEPRCAIDPPRREWVAPLRDLEDLDPGTGPVTPEPFTFNEAAFASADPDGLRDEVLGCAHGRVQAIVRRAKPPLEHGAPSGARVAAAYFVALDAANALLQDALGAYLLRDVPASELRAAIDMAKALTVNATTIAHGLEANAARIEAAAARPAWSPRIIPGGRAN